MSSPKPHPWLIVTVLALAVAPFPVAARAQCAVDQQQAQTGSWIQFVGEGPGGAFAAAQTFQSGAAGILSEIRLFGGVSGFSPGNGPLLVRVFPTTGGLPDESGVPLLAETVPFAALPPVFSPAEFTVDVSQHALSVQPGDALAIVLTVASGTVDWNFRNQPNAYPGGELLSRLEPGGTWAPVGADGYFRTVVCAAGAVPAPEGVAARSWGRTKAGYGPDAP